MLSPAFATTGSHLSPSAQATLNKHLSKHISSKRFIQSGLLDDSITKNLTTQTKTTVVQTAEVACLTGKCYEYIWSIYIYIYNIKDQGLNYFLIFS